jgi:hypothetical protein
MLSNVRPFFDGKKKREKRERFLRERGEEREVMGEADRCIIWDIEDGSSWIERQGWRGGGGGIGERRRTQRENQRERKSERDGDREGKLESRHVTGQRR